MPTTSPADHLTAAEDAERKAVEARAAGNPEAADYWWQEAIRHRGLWLDAVAA